MKTLQNYYRNHKRIKTQVFVAQTVLFPNRAINTDYDIQTAKMVRAFVP